ncbi:MAG: ArsC family reductase [Sphingomonas sp.]|uniref:ArsC family reductase n=1 Tax=Sphingomonas sp. TaxID=28214 RepID=UPI0025E56956|nr:ArsC family reductase [Sphingomonas sp.]MBX9882599.1 ArsC family reductase [Sphingomonas sp.]
MITIYGIKNCDTMKKARAWLDAAGKPYRFHDYRAEGIDPGLLAGWAAQVGWEKLLNKAGTTFRALPVADKSGIDGAKALKLMAANPTLIKRPVLVAGEALLVGFKPELYAATLG